MESYARNQVLNFLDQCCDIPGGISLLSYLLMNYFGILPFFFFFLIEQTRGEQTFFYKVPGSKYLGIYSLWSQLLNCHCVLKATIDMNEQVCLCARRTLLTKAGNKLDVALGHSFLTFTTD